MLRATDASADILLNDPTKHHFSKNLKQKLSLLREQIVICQVWQNVAGSGFQNSQVGTVNYHSINKISDQLTASYTDVAKFGKTALFWKIRSACGTCSAPPLLKKSPIFPTFGQYDLTDVLRKTVEQIFDSFFLSQKRGLRNWAISKKLQKDKPGQSLPTPLTKSRWFLFKGGRIALKTLKQQSVDQIFDMIFCWWERWFWSYNCKWWE